MAEIFDVQFLDCFSFSVLPPTPVSPNSPQDLPEAPGSAFTIPETLHGPGTRAWPLGPEPFATSDKLTTLLHAQGELTVHHVFPQHNNLPNLEFS